MEAGVDLVDEEDSTFRAHETESQGQEAPDAVPEAANRDAARAPSPWTLIWNAPGSWPWNRWVP